MAQDVLSTPQPQRIKSLIGSGDGSMRKAAGPTDTEVGTEDEEEEEDEEPFTHGTR